MFNEFICPFCRGHMMIAGHLIFGVKRKKDNQTGIVLLNPKIGDYTSIVHPKFKVEDGDNLDFYCPMCHENLQASDVNENLVKVIMLDEDEQEHEVFFSGIAGEHCTFKLTGKTIEKMGEAAEDYLEYFRLCKKYKDLL